MSTSEAVPESPAPQFNQPVNELRELTDPKTLRALTHPVRLALLEALALEGPLTATAAGELIGESPTTCSFHFRQLAKYGFVEEAGAGPGRQRPWRLAHIGMRFSGVTDDPEMSIAAKSLERMVFDRALGRLSNYYNTKKDYPKEWQEASESAETILWVSPEELENVTAEILSILQKFHDRIGDPSLRSDGQVPVEVLLFSYPIRHPGSSS
jgi:DNA-binding transcriptional ArsR family regulator